MLDELRMEHGRLDSPLRINDDGGTLIVELNHSEVDVLPPGFRLGDNDTRILAVARNFAAEGREVTLVSKDLPMRVKASAVGLIAEEYHAGLPAEAGWTGMAEVEVVAGALDELYAGHDVASTRWPLFPVIPGWYCSPTAEAHSGACWRTRACGW